MKPNLKDEWTRILIVGVCMLACGFLFCLVVMKELGRFC